MVFPPPSLLLLHWGSRPCSPLFLIQLVLSPAHPWIGSPREGFFYLQWCLLTKVRALLDPPSYARWVIHTGGLPHQASSPLVSILTPPIHKVLASVYYNFIPCTSQTRILWETREVDTTNWVIKSSHQCFFKKKHCFRFSKIFTGCWFYAQPHGIVFIFSSMLTIAWMTAFTKVLMIIFSSSHVHVNRNVTMAMNKVN